MFFSKNYFKIKSLINEKNINYFDEKINFLKNYKESFDNNLNIKLKNGIKILTIIIFFSIICCCLIAGNFKNIYDDLFSQNINKIEKIENYLKLCENDIFYTRKIFKKNLNPKFSIIIPVYNQEKYIKRVITSIQNQSYKNIEIIFVDDASKDNSVKEIKKYQIKDKRITLIRHNVNKGTFITRNDGASISHGEYITFIDPDDLFYENILKNLNKAIKIYNYPDIIKFEAFHKSYNITKIYKYRYVPEKNKIIFHPNILNLTFYMDKNILTQNNLVLWGNIIKRKLFFELLNKLSNYYKKQYFILYEDSPIVFILFKYAKSYVFINLIGYIYCYNEKSTYINRKKTKNINTTINNIFLLAEIFFDYTDDNEYEKLMAMYQLRRLIKEYKKALKMVTKGFKYYYKVLNKFSECKSILPENHKKVEIIRKILLILEKKNNNKIYI